MSCSLSLTQGCSASGITQMICLQKILQLLGIITTVIFFNIILEITYKMYCSSQLLRRYLHLFYWGQYRLLGSSLCTGAFCLVNNDDNLLCYWNLPVNSLVISTSSFSFLFISISIGGIVFIYNVGLLGLTKNQYYNLLRHN